jgi:nitrite reductase (NADH) large subunit
MGAVLGGRPAGLTSLRVLDHDIDERGRLVVVGNGMAGARFVEEVLDRGGEQFRITVFGEEPHGNYNRIMLSPVLAGEEHEDDIVLNSHDWYADNGVDLRAGVRVERIDTAAKLVLADDGTATPYDHLVLATGSSSFVPPVRGVRRDDGSLLPGVFGFRTIDDTRAMIDAAGTHHRAVVVGGGLLGLEAARALQTYGMTVDLVDAAPHLMSAQCDADAGAIIRAGVEALGITVHLSTLTGEVLGPDRVRGVVLSDGRNLEADMLVLAAGIRPNTDVAVLSGLDVERAIVVDDQLRTDDPDVYAIGECAQHRGTVYGLVAPAWEHARVLADVLTGTDPTAEYHGSRLATKLKVAGVDVATMGVKTPERPEDEFLVISEPKRGVHLSVVIRDDRLAGATLIGDTRKVAYLTQAFDRGSPLPEERIRLLVDLSDGAAEVGVAEMPGESQVCNCNGVTKQTLCDTVRDGCSSVGAVMDRTRAGKGCGSCKSLVKQIVEWATDGAVTEDASAGWYVPGVPLAKPELMTAIREQGLRSVSAVFAALAPGGAEDAKSKMGLTSLLRMMWGADFVDERDARFINDRVHANIQRDGTFSVVPQIKGGVTTPAELRRIADVAEKYEVPMVKITGGQRIDLLGVRKEDLPGM